MRRIALIGLLSTLALATILAGPAVAGYDQPDGPVEVPDSTPAPGQTMRVRGGGFAPYSQVTILIRSEPQVLATVQADGQGYVDAEITVPADIPTGTHTLEIQGLDTDGEVRVLATPVDVGGTGGSGLPRTGAAIGAMVGAGLVLVTLGTVLTRLRRRAEAA
ncbi:MAG: hypothetical protein M5U14_13680 [Acidimicrobiia bacterium]|nr:hypothetical protein [Acidimicrobiia bacterium]